MLLVEHLQGARGPARSFRVERGACLLITGPSGVGKTTLLRMLADLEPSQGTVRLDDLNRDAVPAPRWRKQVTWVPAEPRFWEDTALGHVPPGQQAAFRRLTDQLGVDGDALDRPVGTLSSGEQQRVALARALVNGPSVLLLDEPTASLDAGSAAKVEAVLAQWLHEGGTCVVVSHRPLALPHHTLELSR